ncbi:TIGR02996 domain-containing protein, partial [Propionibacterium freudenreichii]|uniref:TIGR02996 domain-containing protein n=1 Tax=Propionibacterium freudenreichii TaxID=1744 RepID=UPI0038572AA3
MIPSGRERLVPAPPAAARLVYGDWLEERADLPRAEALRLQQERGVLADDAPGGERRARVEARILELLPATRPAWR